MATESVLVNGKVFDFTCCRLDIMGIKVSGFTGIDFSDKIERGEGRGASQIALGVSRGKYTADPIKITMHKTTGGEVRAGIAAKSRTGKSLGQVKGTIVLQTVDDDLGVQTTTFMDCRVNVPGTGSFKDGTDPLTEDWEFYTRKIDRDGITLYESDEPGA